MLYCSWDMACDRCNYFSFWAILSHFIPLKAPKIQNSNKMKKKKKLPGDIKCTKNHDHMLYCSWDTTCDWCNYFSFWAIFCLFTPVTIQKMIISKNWKKNPRDIIILHSCTKNHDDMLYCSWNMDLIVIFHFGQFFALLPP